jgi:diaminopimelate decarboxylase
VLQAASAAGSATCDVAAGPDRLPAGVRDHLLTGSPAGAPRSGYLYDPAVARQRARTLRAALPGWSRLLFAVKANTFPPVLAALAGVVDGFEIASIAEAALAARAMRSAGRPGLVVAAGPAKHPALLAGLLDAGVDVIHVESALELRRLSDIAADRGLAVSVAVRVNPSRVSIRGTLGMGGRSAPFGVPEPQVPEVLALARSLPGVNVAGFHVHAVCGNRDALAHVAHVAWCLDWAAHTAVAEGLDLRWVDVGGGLGVAYGDGDPLDLAVLADGLAQLRPPMGVEVAWEPGRWLAADCGWYAAEVVDVKESYGAAYAIVRGGIGGLALPATEDFPLPLVVLPVDDWPGDLSRPELCRTRVTVAGELCTPEDVLVRDVFVDRIRAGDLVVIPQAGAYGWEFAFQAFLGHPPATREVVAGVPVPDPPQRVLEVAP